MHFLIHTLLIMKKLLRCLVMPALFAPLLIPSKVSAFGPGPQYGLQARERSHDEPFLDRGRLDPEQNYLRRFDPYQNRFNDPAGDPTKPPTTTPPVPGGENAPLDGGLSLLLAAGIGLGMKKAIARNKASKQEISDAAE